MSAVVDTHPLDNPAWLAMTGSQAACAEVRGHAARFRPDVSPFVALADESGWPDLAALVGAGGLAVLAGVSPSVPDGWRQLSQVAGVQLVDVAMEAEPAPEAVRLGVDDVPEMLDLVERTQPGPFRPRTVELGTYLGIRIDGALVAMAGERMRPPGWTEISAVCTDPAYRGRGLAGRLVRAVAYVIRERGDVPFLHTGAANEGAIRLYESLGFKRRREAMFTALTAPD
ncbi:GNAT family N-acetyltransferase [Fodinicola acaciae]|uniref:GNAT family N-acetyltransferase n=1 Tax=Fodinicola acaciae TaxID=2681555 RepID=UPI0013D0FAB5|nr:GNAT family N-acetyltransferase [Fodinicola acaciae]